MTKRILSVLFMMFLAFSAMAQEGHLRGKVIDNKTGETLIGVTVAVVGTTMGTTTDFDGNYSLNCLPVITISGYPIFLINPRNMKMLKSMMEM